MVKRELLRQACTMPETDAQYFARIGSKDALKERVQRRLGGQINKQKPVWGIAKCVRYLMLKWGKRVPDELAPVGPYVPTPHTVLPAPKEPKRRKKWTSQRGRSSN